MLLSKLKLHWKNQSLNKKANLTFSFRFASSVLVYDLHSCHDLQLVNKNVNYELVCLHDRRRYQSNRAASVLSLHLQLRCWDAESDWCGTHPVVNEETAAHRRGSPCSSNSSRPSISFSLHALICCSPAFSTFLLTQSHQPFLSSSKTSSSFPLASSELLTPLGCSTFLLLNSPSLSQVFCTVVYFLLLLLLPIFSLLLSTLPRPPLQLRSKTSSAAPLSSLSSTTPLSGSADPQEQEHLTMCVCVCVSTQFPLDKQEVTVFRGSWPSIFRIFGETPRHQQRRPRQKNCKSLAEKINPRSKREEPLECVDVSNVRWNVKKQFGKKKKALNVQILHIAMQKEEEEKRIAPLLFWFTFPEIWSFSLNNRPLLVLIQKKENFHNDQTLEKCSTRRAGLFQLHLKLLKGSYKREASCDFKLSNPNL